jgi:hypothetical protein
MTEWDLAYMRRKVEPQGLTDADLDRIADAVPVDTIGVHITTWHRRFARAVLAAQPAPVPAKCDGGTCGLGGYCNNCPKQATAPVPVPLTEDRIAELWVAILSDTPANGIHETEGLDWVRLARAIEAHHGIGIAASPEVTK